MNDKEAHALAVAMAKGIMGRDYSEVAQPEDDNNAYRKEPTLEDYQEADIVCGSSFFKCSKCNSIIQVYCNDDDVMFCPYCGRNFIGWLMENDN